jgi:hypothetical protein
MKRMFRLLVLPLAVVVLGAGSADALRVGAAVTVLTPKEPMPLSGGVGTPAPPKGQLGDLFARVMVFEEGETRVAIVGLDYLGFPGVLGDQIRAKVQGVPGSNILIGASHTHSGPDMYAFPDGQGGHNGDMDYIQWVIDQTAATINTAVERLEPAVLKINVGEARGKIAFNYYAPQLYDPRVSVIQALKPDGETVIATLVNYASHPEVLGSKRGMLSPDFCGPLYDRIESKAGGVAVFMNGAQGGMVTADNRDVPEDTESMWKECVRIGELLADEALRVVSEAPVQAAPKVFCASERLSFPVTSPLIMQLFDHSGLDYSSVSDGKNISTQMNLVNIGTAQLVTIPGEALPNIGYYLKRNMPGDHDFLLGLTNDAFGYILSRVDFMSFERYDYVTRTSLGEGTGPILIEKILSMVEKYPAPATP